MVKHAQRLPCFRYWLFDLAEWWKCHPMNTFRLYFTLQHTDLHISKQEKSFPHFELSGALACINWLLGMIKVKSN